MTVKRNIETYEEFLAALQAKKSDDRVERNEAKMLWEFFALNTQSNLKNTQNGMKGLKRCRRLFLLNLENLELRQVIKNSIFASIRSFR